MKIKILILACIVALPMNNLPEATATFVDTGGIDAPVYHPNGTLVQPVVYRPDGTMVHETQPRAVPNNIPNSNHNTNPIQPRTNTNEANNLLIQGRPVAQSQTGQTASSISIIPGTNIYRVSTGNSLRIRPNHTWGPEVNEPSAPISTAQTTHSGTPNNQAVTEYHASLGGLTSDIHYQGSIEPYVDRNENSRQERLITPYDQNYLEQNPNVNPTRYQRRTRTSTQSNPQVSVIPAQPTNRFVYSNNEIQERIAEHNLAVGAGLVLSAEYQPLISSSPNAMRQSITQRPPGPLLAVPMDPANNGFDTHEAPPNQIANAQCCNIS